MAGHLLLLFLAPQSVAQMDRLVLLKVCAEATVHSLPLAWNCVFEPDDVLTLIVSLMSVVYAVQSVLSEVDSLSFLC